MSILIKGMEMPKHCRNCRFSYFTHGTSMKCLFISEACKIHGRLPNCPLVEIPSKHGRLIDADKLLESFGEAIDEDSHFVNFFSLVDKAPTIIESEG